MLGLIDQFELLTLVDDKMLVRILYDNKGEVVLLRETETIQPKPDIIVVDQHPVVSNNDTTSTQTSSNTTTTNTDSTISTNTTTSVFTAYEYKYIGNDILAQYSSN